MSSFADEVAALRGTKSATLRDLLTHPPFARLAAAMTVSSLGDWVGFIAVTALAARLGTAGGGAYAVAGVMIARSLPAVLFGPFAGAIVDRVNRKRLMMGADLGRAAMYASMPFLQNLTAIYVLSFAIESLSLMWVPARDATMPRLVPRRQLANANSLALLSSYGTLPLGGLVFTIIATLSNDVLGGAVRYFKSDPESLALWLDAGTFGFSALMISGIAMRNPVRRGMPKLDLSAIGRDIVEGFRFLRGHSLASAMTTGIVVAFSAVGAVLAIGPVYAKLTLGAGAEGWGLLVTSFGVGMGIGMASVNRLHRLVDREMVFAGSMIAAAATLFVLASMPTIALAAFFAIVLGFFCGATWVSGYVLLQENVTDEYRGRTFGSLTVMSRTGLFLSLTAFPIIAGVVGAHEVYVGGHRLDLSGTRVALWTAGLGVIIAGVVTRKGLSRYRLSRPMPLGLVPKLRRPPSKGIFVAFEGVEGSGKGTQVERARELLESKGLDVLVTREPGGTDIGEQLRSVLLDTDTGHLEPRTEALLFAAARAQHVAGVIRPALVEGKVVVCDRYIDSSLAYQGWARGLGEQDVLTLNVWATQGLFPDLVVLLHVEPEEGLRRVSDSQDRIESEGTEFLAKVSDAYLKIAEEHPERVVVVDASGSEDAVHEKVRDALERLLAEREEDDGKG